MIPLRRYKTIWNKKIRRKIVSTSGSGASSYAISAQSSCFVFSEFSQLFQYFTFVITMWNEVGKCLRTVLCLECKENRYREDNFDCSVMFWSAIHCFFIIRMVSILLFFKCCFVFNIYLIYSFFVSISIYLSMSSYIYIFIYGKLYLCLYLSIYLSLYRYLCIC